MSHNRYVAKAFTQDIYYVLNMFIIFLVFTLLQGVCIVREVYRVYVELIFFSLECCGLKI